MPTEPCQHNWVLQKEGEIVIAVCLMVHRGLRKNWSLKTHALSNTPQWRYTTIGTRREWYCSICRCFDSTEEYSRTREEWLADGYATHEITPGWRTNAEWLWTLPPDPKIAGADSRVACDNSHTLSWEEHAHSE